MSKSPANMLVAVGSLVTPAICGKAQSLPSTAVSYLDVALKHAGNGNLQSALEQCRNRLDAAVKQLVSAEENSELDSLSRLLFNEGQRLKLLLDGKVPDKAVVPLRLVQALALGGAALLRARLFSADKAEENKTQLVAIGERVSAAGVVQWGRLLAEARNTANAAKAKSGGGQLSEQLETCRGGIAEVREVFRTADEGTELKQPAEKLLAAALQLDTVLKGEEASEQLRPDLLLSEMLTAAAAAYIGCRLLSDDQDDTAPIEAEPPAAEVEVRFEEPDGGGSDEEDALAFLNGPDESSTDGKDAEFDLSDEVKLAADDEDDDDGPKSDTVIGDGGS